MLAPQKRCLLPRTGAGRTIPHPSRVGRPFPRSPQAAHPRFAELMIKIGPILEAPAARLWRAGQGCLPSALPPGINHSPDRGHDVPINAGMGLPAPILVKRRETSPEMRPALGLLLLLATTHAMHRGKGISPAPGALTSPGEQGGQDEGDWSSSSNIFLVASPLRNRPPNRRAGIRGREGKVRGDGLVPRTPLGVMLEELGWREEERTASQGPASSPNKGKMRFSEPLHKHCFTFPPFSTPGGGKDAPCPPFPAFTAPQGTLPLPKKDSKPSELNFSRTALWK